jgi:NTE family protein
MARIGVVFSSGFFGFFAHAGFLRALRELGIEVSGYAGASSGAIVASMAAAGMSDESIRQVLFRLKRSDFWDPEPARRLIREVLRRFRGYTGYLKGEGFAGLLDQIPLRRIEDSPVPLLVAATNLTRRRQELFTEGNLVRTLQASGAVPMLFKPVEIGGSLYVDGGVVTKAPLVGLADLLKPEKIIVHLIPSADMTGEGGDFLKRPYTPWHIQHLTFSICRREAYKREQTLLRERGVQIQEVVADPPPVGPGSLAKGPSAYDKVYRRTLEILSRS